MIFLLFEIALYLDIAQFYQTPTKTNCEIYYSMPTKELKLKEKAGKFTAEFTIILRITDETTKEIFIDTLQKVMNISNLETEVEFTDVQNVILTSKRRYNISMEAENTEGEPWKAETLIVSREWSGGLIFSDIQISHTLFETYEENRFVKNNYKLIPFPRREFDKNRYLLASYCELYGLEGDSVLISYIIEGRGDGEDTIFNDYYEVLGDRMAIPMISNVLGYPPRSYNVKFIARNEREVAVARKGFSVTEVKRIASFSIPDSIFDYASFINYVASSREISDFKKLSVEGRRMFLLKFWMRRDPVPETRENEALNEFVRRVKYTDKYFSVGRDGKKGRSTEIGRVYIKYGPPDDIIRKAIEIEAEPYIMWHYYDLDEWFIFMDRGLSGEYFIIYSSVDGEPTEPGWRSLILLEDLNRISDFDF